jgi:hypothetical protein
MWLNRAKAILVFVLIAGACICLVLSVAGHAGKWLSSAGLMFDLAGITQLEMAGLFSRMLEKYGDVKRYPSGPPSYITRELSNEADSRLTRWVNHHLFYDLKTGFRLIVLGCLLQLAGVWII